MIFSRMNAAFSVVFSLAVLAAPAGAATVTSGNLLVSVNEFTGSNTAERYVAEFDVTGGNRVQRTPAVVSPTGNFDQIRDLVVRDNNVYLYNGTFDPRVATYDFAAASPTWTQAIGFSEWSTANNISYGGLGLYQDFLYATDTDTPGAEAKGVVRFDLSGGPTIRFGTTGFGTANTEPIDLTVDGNGNVFALTEDTVEVFDANGIFQNEIALTIEDWRDIDVASDGSIVAGTFGGDIVRFAADGTQLDTLALGNINLVSLDINDDTGEIAIGSRFGDVFLTDLNLDTFSSFGATEAGSGEVFVRWVEATAVPEPSSCGVLMITGLLLLRRRKRSVENKHCFA